MIRIGQAGIPLSCKGRTNKDGIVYTHKNLDLNAIEIQFVRGLYILSDEEAQFIKEYAQKNDIEIHVHAPYYLNLAGDKEEVAMSFEKILKSAQMADSIGSKTVIIHPGFYGENNPKKTMKLIVKNSKKIVSLLKKERLKTKLAIETMGKQKVFGSLDEIIEICRSVKDVVPVIDLGHIHARGNGCLKEKEDFEAIFDKLKPLRLRHYLLHITGVLYENGNELYHLPIKKGDMPLAPLIDVILDRKLNVTLISESPLLEHDAVYVRLQVEKAIMKRTGKEVAYYKDLSEVS
ncbi:MAG TPA: TIM barrel protein [Candidatus Thermoplasmatota archaeon]|nr:TIM barrel protein [Candidatus Thermoplasmatota archaeon]